MRIRERIRELWEHRTKALGVAMLSCGYVIEHQGELVNFLSPAHAGRVVEVFGALAFALGAYNTFAIKHAAAAPPTA